MAWLGEPPYFHIYILVSSLYHQNRSIQYCCCISLPCLQFRHISLYICFLFTCHIGNEITSIFALVILQKKHLNVSVGFIKGLESKPGPMWELGHQFNQKYSISGTGCVKRLHSHCNIGCWFQKSLCQMGA